MEKFRALNCIILLNVESVKFLDEWKILNYLDKASSKETTIYYTAVTVFVHLQTILYCCKSYEIMTGLKYYLTFGTVMLPTAGIVEVIKMDARDGNTVLYDIIEYIKDGGLSVYVIRNGIYTSAPSCIKIL